MQTVAETSAFQRAAERSGMSRSDVMALTQYLALHPDAGDVIPGTGGCRKLRFGSRDKKTGKSGGYRTITFYTGKDLPVFLITVFAKGDRSDLTQAERNELGKMTKEIAAAYSKRVVAMGSRT